VQKLSNYQNGLSKCGGHKSTHFQEQIKADKKFNCTFLNRHNRPFNVNTGNLCWTIGTKCTKCSKTFLVIN
jgi:hypothetical protein